MSGSTWKWVGSSTTWATSNDWSLASGSGNGSGYPAAGDTALVGSGTPSSLSIAGSELNGNTIDLSGGASIEFGNGSTLDGKSVVNVSAGTIDVTGTFTDLGNIELDGSSSALTISLASGATLVSDGLKGLDIGINVGQPASLNNGDLVLSGGTLANQEIHINDGTATVNTAFQSNDLISITGGLLDMTEQGSASPNLAFVAASAPSTVKFENPGAFGGSISGFASGDTIDLGSSTIGKLVYTPSSGYGTLQLENASGTTIFSTILSGGDTASFAATTATVNASGTTVAGNFQVIQGSGDTLITEATSSPTPTPTPTPTPSPTPTPTPTPAPTPTPTPTPSPTPGQSSLGTDGYTLLTTIKLPGGIGGHGDWVSYDASTKTIWVAQTPDSNVDVISTANNQLAAVIPGIAANGIDETASDAFVADTAKNTTDVISTSTYQKVGQTAQTGTTPDSVTFVPSTNQIYVASDDANVLDALNTTSPFAQTASYALLPGGTTTGPDVATTAKNLIYIPDNTQVAAIDPTNGSILASPTLVTTGAVKPGVYDPVTDTFFFGTTNGYIDVVSGGSGAGGIGSVVGTIAVPGATDEAAIDVTNRLAFFGDKTGVVDIVNLDSRTLVGQLPAEPNMHTLAVDPTTHDVYVYENNSNTVDVWNYGSLVTTGTTTLTPSASGLVQLGTVESQSATVRNDGSGTTITVNQQVINAGTADQIAFADGTLDIGSGSPAGEAVRLYQTVLGRGADTGGLVYWSSAIAGGASTSSVAQAMLSSTEGQTKLPSSLSNTAFVTQLYHNAFNRAPGSGGLGYWTDQLNSGTSRAVVAASIANSSEEISDTASQLSQGVWLPNQAAVAVENLYYTALNRAPDAGGLQYYTSQLESGAATLQQIAQTMVNSPEFIHNFGSLSGSALVTQVYQDALGRAPDAGGLDYWSGRSTAGMMAGISQSPERMALNIGNQGIAVTRIV